MEREHGALAVKVNSAGFKETQRSRSPQLSNTCYLVTKSFGGGCVVDAEQVSGYSAGAWSPWAAGEARS